MTEDPINRRVVERTEQTLRDGTGADSYPVEIEHADGRRILLDVYERPIVQDDRTVGIQGVAHDITERKRAKEALRQSEELYRSLVETSPDGITLVDPDICVKMANQRAAELLGFDKSEDLVGKNGLEFIAPEDRELAREDLQRTIETGGVRNVEYTLLRRDGSQLPGDFSASVTVDAEGKPTGCIVVARDITERKRLQQQLLQSQKLESIGTLAGGIAHDFGNLLAVVVGNVSMLQRRDDLPAKARDLLRDALAAAERGAALTQQLLAYARGGLQKPAPTDLNRIVKSVLQLLRATSPQQIEFAQHLPKNLPLVMTDPSQADQVVMNLCLNAIQAVQPPGTIEISTRAVTIGPDQSAELELAAGEYVHLQVRDRGSGMDDETIKRAFEPFFTTKPMGRGMGLAATQGIVHSHNGQIRIDSAPTSGTTVSVWLPVAAQKTPAVARQPAPKTMDPPHGSEAVLVIDDDPSVANTIGLSLSSLGYCPVAHTDVYQALAFLDTNAEDVDLILLDLQMPKHPDVLTKIQQRCPQVPVVMISGMEDREKVDALSARGAAGFVRKPFTLMALATAVRNALDKQGPPKPSG